MNPPEIKRKRGRGGIANLQAVKFLVLFTLGFRCCDAELLVMHHNSNNAQMECLYSACKAPSNCYTKRLRERKEGQERRRESKKGKRSAQNNPLYTYFSLTWYAPHWQKKIMYRRSSLTFFFLFFFSLKASVCITNHRLI